MKKVIILCVILIASIGMVYAFDYTYFPTATTDDFLATKVNPAALGFGNASGVGYLHSFQDKHMQKNWALFFNLKDLGYCYEKMDSTELHTLSDGSKLAKNVYFGDGLCVETSRILERRLGIILSYPTLGFPFYCRIVEKYIQEE